ncbi:hypothetical protein FKM82_029404 [Ascaphus truei]
MWAVMISSFCHRGWSGEISGRDGGLCSSPSQQRGRLLTVTCHFNGSVTSVNGFIAPQVLNPNDISWYTRQKQKNGSFFKGKLTLWLLDAPIL